MPVSRCDIVHVVNQMRPGGIETMVADLVKSSRHTSLIFSLEGTGADLVAGWPLLAQFASRLEGFDRPPRVDPKLVLRIARRLRQLSPRAIFLHRTNPLLYGGMAARLAGVPAIVHVEHDVWHYGDPRRRRLLHWANRLTRPRHFAISSEIADTLRKMLPGADISVVPGGVDLARFQVGDTMAARTALDLPPEARVVGTAGRLEKVKGHEFLVKAMAHLPSDVMLVLVGKGSAYETLAESARALGVDDRVRFFGHRDDLERVFPAFDVFCLPSLNEGLPRVLMEAQAAGLPIVATDVGAVRRIVAPSSGRLVTVGDPLALAEAISATLAAPSSREACRRYAEANFGIDRMVATYDAMADV